ncbi:hypothetical protein LAJ19_04610 [Deinococcus taeanensis]|uniref:hypothetical protein n=1 Tax=Deinococcus taeanensis TaxID=2737050 RepID=UPI001CDBACF6|nr:hypothetical protein [Deinococcus taeanensis]UBV43500.1 hypothetical protein LAJ19_04610 [Deinococcus taeanensis]
MNRIKRLAFLMGMAATAAWSGSASAADLRLSVGSSLGLSCQVASARVALEQDRFGVFGEGAYCLSNVEGQSGRGAFDAGLTVNLLRAGPVTGYVLGGVGRQASSTVTFAGVGARYGIALIPVEGFVEAGVQRINTALQPVVGPRFNLGLTYRMNVGDLSRYGAPAATAGTDFSGAGTGAPEQCNLTPEQDAAAAKAATVAAANEALSALASSYSAGFSSFAYQVNVGGVSINGNAATVSGSVTISLTSRGSGERTTDTFPGSVNLVRSGCGWRAIGYTRG